MMNEYEKQAMKFCEKNVESMEITLIGKDINENWYDSVYRNKYMFTITTKIGKYSNYFWDSEYNTKNKIKPTRYDILACLIKYNPGTFNEFCDEFGYNNNSMRDFKTYQDVCEEWEGISKIFTEEQLEELREIQ